MKRILVVGLMIIFLLAGCCSSGHMGFIRSMDDSIGSTLDPAYAGTIEKYWNKKAVYKNKIVYTDTDIEKISFDGNDLTSTGAYCKTTFLLDEKNHKVVDWKYLKGSNPSACQRICGY